jgi:hypothetical protein
MTIQANFVRTFTEVNDEEGTISSEEWKPSHSNFTKFVETDKRHAVANVRRVLKEANRPMSFKELKECLLHSNDMLDKVISSELKLKHLVETKGRYYFNS